MKQIELTEKHKDKLLTMGMTLFGREFDSINNNNFICKMIFRNKQWRVVDKIHWYEFCATHLSNAIFNHKNYPDNGRKGNLNGLTAMVQEMFWYSKSFHIVDYLYNEYLLTTKEAVYSRLMSSTNICS